MTNEELKEKLIGIIRQGFIDADCKKAEEKFKEENKE